MSDFDYRVRIAETFQSALFSTVGNMGFKWAINGTEHTHPEFVKNLTSSTDQTSLSIRFQPDGICSIGNAPRCFYLEAKNGRNIEQTAYEQYMIHHKNGNVVVVVFGGLNNHWAFIEDITLIDGEETVSRYRNPLPTMDGWIAPRLLPLPKYLKWKQKNQIASGTPYKEVDKQSLTDFKLFKQLVIDRLKLEA